MGNRESFYGAMAFDQGNFLGKWENKRQHIET